MRKIHYPSENMMNNQIEQILDKSGLFEEDKINTEQVTEYVQVRETNIFKSMIPIVLSVAAIAIVVLTIKGVRKETASNGPEVLTAISEEETKVEDKFEAYKYATEDGYFEISSKTIFLKKSPENVLYELADEGNINATTYVNKDAYAYINIEYPNNFGYFDGNERAENFNTYFESVLNDYVNESMDILNNIPAEALEFGTGLFSEAAAYRRNITVYTKRQVNYSGGSDAVIAFVENTNVDTDDYKVSSDYEKEPKCLAAYTVNYRTGQIKKIDDVEWVKNNAQGGSINETIYTRLYERGYVSSKMDVYLNKFYGTFDDKNWYYNGAIVIYDWGNTDYNDYGIIVIDYLRRS